MGMTKIPSLSYPTICKRRELTFICSKTLESRYCNSSGQSRLTLFVGVWVSQTEGVAQESWSQYSAAMQQLGKG